MGYINVEVDVDIDVNDIIGEIETFDLVDELLKRGYEVNEATASCFLLRKDYLSKDELRRHLCDITGVGYYTDNEKLLTTIKELL